jgi:DNA-directed RNA polymerase specialized sigma24 family protein
MAVNATVDQFRAAFAGLNKLERIGLAQLARRMASGASGYTSGEDLLSEAVVRTLSGRRHWPLDVPVETFIANAMRSIVFAARDSKEMSARDFSFDLDERLSPSPDAWQHGPPTPEEICLRRERRDLGLAAIDFAREALRQDTEALNVLEGLAADMSAEETRAQLGIDLQTYKAARERVRYRLKDWNEGKPQ